jgi:hypothetical protein
LKKQVAEKDWTLKMKEVDQRMPQAGPSELVAIGSGWQYQ